MPNNMLAMQPGVNMLGMGQGGFPSMDPARDRYTAWQAAQAEYDRLAGLDPTANWMPETRKNARGEVEYLVGDKWARQAAWDDPRFQEMVVNPWKEQALAKAREEHSRTVADAQAKAAQMQYDYDNYLQQQEEIKASSALSKSPGTGPTRRMMGVGRGGY